ncbi:MAG: hypothetical protein K1060chlam4_00377 [Candidatus Anoxychlamydiales bacterium]|nr:hypothetical protein [Candidatus Anoxychlamydiales bacterium]
MTVAFPSHLGNNPICFPNTPTNQLIEDLIISYIGDKSPTINKEELLYSIHNSIPNEVLFNKVLFKAVKSIDFDIVFALITAQKIDVNAVDENSITALFYCCELNAYNIAKLLLQNGANVNFKDDLEDTPLMHAIVQSNAEMVKLIIFYDALINDKNLQGTSALMYAASNLNFEKMKILIDNGANVDDFDNKKITILMEAIVQMESNKKVSAIKILDLILDKTQNIDAQDNLGETALMKTKSVEIAEKLLDKKASLSIRNLEGQTPLLVAAKDCVYDLIDLYIARRADPSIIDKDGWTALMLAAHSYHSKPTIEKLLPYSAKIITYQNNMGLTALKIAVFNKNIAATTTLLQNGAFPESNDKENMDVATRNFTNIAISEEIFQEGRTFRVSSNEQIIYYFGLMF